MFDDDGNLPDDSILLLADNRGIYLPQDFARDFHHDYISNVSPDQWAILESGPNHEWYWETWSEVESNAILHDPDLGEMYLYQDGDLWAIPNRESD